jgi:hypothetical protein
MSLIAPGLRYDQPEVGVDHPLLGLEVSALDPLGELDLLGCGEQRVDPSPAQEELERIRRAIAQLGGLQTLAGVRTAPPVLPGISLRRPGPSGPLRLGCIGFMIATRAWGAVAMGISIQFLSPVCRQGSMHIEL